MPLNLPPSAKTSSLPPSECCKNCGAHLERGDNGDCNRCGEKWVAKGASLKLPEITQSEDPGDDVNPDPMLRYDIHQGDKNLAYAAVRPTSTEGDGPWVSGVYVDPDHRGQGLAKRLMHRIEQDNAGKTIRLRAKPYKDESLTTEQLMSMYAALGYESYDKDEPSRMKKVADRCWEGYEPAPGKEPYSEDSCRPVGKKKKKKKVAGEVLGHIGGIAGAGKTTLLESIRERHPSVRVQDLDELDDAARDSLEMTGQSWTWPEETQQKHLARFQELLDQKIDASSDPIVLGGFHWTGLDGAVDPRTENRLLLDTSPYIAAYRRYRRSRTADNRFDGDEGNMSVMDAIRAIRTGKANREYLVNDGWRPVTDAEAVEQQLNLSKAARESRIETFEDGTTLTINQDSDNEPETDGTCRFCGNNGLDDGRDVCGQCLDTKAREHKVSGELAIPEIKRTRVVMPYQDGYLMERMNNPKYPDNLGRVRFPGGGVEPGETPQQAAVRELKEELGLRIRKSKLRSLGVHTEADFGPEEYFELKNHQLTPGNYTATVGGDKEIEIVQANTDHPQYWGGRIDSLTKQSNELTLPIQPITQPFQLAPPQPVKPLPPMRRIDDVDAMRTDVYDSVLQAASTMEPIVGPTHTLAVSDVHYATDDPEFSKAAQKKAILENGSLSRRLRGTWRLIDNTTGEQVSERQTTLANVPAILHDGSFLRRGTRYAMGYQQRLRPGVYTRNKDNGAIESQIAVKTGHGRSHRYVLEPETGKFHVEVGHAKVPLLPLLQTLGADDEQIKEAMGNSLYEANIAKSDTAAMTKLYDRLVPKKLHQEGDKGDPGKIKERLREAFEDMIVDPEVVESTLGRAAERIDADMILRSVKEIVKLSRGERDPDDRDHLAYSTIHSAPDIFAERFTNDYDKVRRELLRKVVRKGNLDGVPASVLDRQVDAAIFKSGLALTVEDQSPLELLSAMTKVTKYGEGGLGSTSATPKESRNVNVGQFGFIDPVVTPESLKIGVDGYLARNVQLGKDGKLYNSVLNRQGEEVFASPTDIIKTTFSVGPSSIDGMDMVIDRGKMRLMPAGSAEYQTRSPDDLFSHAASATPMKSGQAAGRTAMASRVLAQSMAVDNAEAPLVQSGQYGDDRSYEEFIGERMGAVRAKEGGRVIGAGDDFIEVKYAGGQKEKIELDINRPGARKSIFNQEPVVQIGQDFNPGDLLVRSNFTDKNGTMAAGLNVRTALMSLDDNWEDGLVISESLAKRFQLQQAYKYSLDTGDGTAVDKNKFLTRFGTKYEKTQLDKLDDAGVVQVGQTVSKGDPLILGTREKQLVKGRVHRSGKSNWSDASVVWEHNHDGVVTDIVQDRKGARVVVKTGKGLETGDKLSGRQGNKGVLCYDEQTQLLTSTGWRPFPEVTEDDLVATKVGDGFEFRKPKKLIVSHYQGEMVRFNGLRVDQLVTPNHRMAVVDDKESSDLRFVEASEFPFRAKTHLPMTVGAMRQPEVVRGEITVPSHYAGKGHRCIYTWPSELFCQFLGWYLTEGNVAHYASDTVGAGKVKVRSYKVQIAQSATASAEHCKTIRTMLDKMGVAWRHLRDSQFTFGNKALWHYLKPLGICNTKRVPREIIENASREDLHALLDAMIDGDGTRYDGDKADIYRTSSPQLADDVHEIATRLGFAAWTRVQNGGRVAPRGNHPQYVTHIARAKKTLHLEPSHVSREAYDGMIYCVDMGGEGTVCVRRNGKSLWCGNSIVPDAQMPHDEDGNPIEMAISPQAVPSRGNSAFPIELLLGEVAKRRGQPYKIKDFGQEDLWEYAANEAKKHGVPESQTLIDPNTGRKIKNVAVGQLFTMALSHIAEAKQSARGLGSYTCFDKETDVLTEQGWKSWADVTSTDKLASINAEDRLVYESPTELTSQPYSGLLYGFSGKYVDYLVTPNHRMCVRQRLRGRPNQNLSWQFVYAEDMPRRKSGWASRQADFSPDVGRVVDVIEIPVPPINPRATKTYSPLHLDAGDYAELVGWFLSEGSTTYVKKSREFNISIAQVENANPMNFKQLAALLDRLPFNWIYNPVDPQRQSRGRRGFRIRNKQLYFHLASFGKGCSNKRIPRQLLDAQIEVRQRLFDSLIKGDGSEYASPGSANHYFKYATTSKGLADDVQELAIRLGMGAAVSLARAADPESNRLALWVVGIHGNRKVAHIGEQRRSSARYYTQQYSGDVYCATVPSGLLIVRRNGKVLVTGNSTGEPARGAKEGAQSKRYSGQQLFSSLSHGAYNLSRENSMLKGRRNDDYWSAFMSGDQIGIETVPENYQGFMDRLKAAGINPIRRGTKTQLMAMTDKDTEQLSGGRTVTVADTVNLHKELEPIKGGFFDPRLFGEGEKFAQVELPVAMPNPVYEEPIRRILNLTEKKFRSVLGGTEELQGHGTGPDALASALGSMNVDEEIKQARALIDSGKKTKRDEGVRKLKFLRGLKKTGVEPKDLLVTKVPVLPPRFRPIAQLQGKGGVMVNDANYLYKELMLSSGALASLRGKLDDTSEETLALYDSHKALVGLTDPKSQELKQRKVKGLLKTILGKHGPKTGMMNRKLLSGNIDTVGRGTIMVDSNLDMDSIGLPETTAFKIFEPYIVRNLVQRGVPRVQAMEYLKDRNSHARDALIQEMGRRPVTTVRAPVLHKYGDFAQWGQLVKGDTIRWNPPVTPQAGGDFDGDRIIGSVIFRKTRESSLAPGADCATVEGSFTSYNHCELPMAAIKNAGLPYRNGDQFFVCDLEDFPHLDCYATTKGKHGVVDWYRVPEGIEVLSYHSESAELRWTPTTCWSVHRGCETDIVTLQSKRQIFTDDDPRGLLVCRPEESLDVVPRSPRDLGDVCSYVPRVKTQPDSVIPADQRLHTVSLPADVKAIVDADQHGKLKFTLPGELPLTQQLGWFIGAMCGDGWASLPKSNETGRSPGMVCLCGSHDEIFNKFAHAIAEIVVPLNGDDIEVTLTHREGDGTADNGYGSTWKAVFCNKLLPSLVVSLCGKGAAGKHLPAFYLAANRDFRNGVLAGLMDTDGTVGNQKKSSRAGTQFITAYTTISLRLAREVALLAMSCGIRCVISCSKTSTAGNKLWLVSMSAIDFKQWFDSAGSQAMVHPVKHTEASQATVDAGSSVALRQDKVPCPPEVVDLVFATALVVPADHPLRQTMRNAAGDARKKSKFSVTRKTAQLFIEFIGRKAIAGLPQGSQWLRIVEDESTTWDLVTNIEATGSVDTGYDLTVPGPENWMSTDGTIVPNTVNVSVPHTREAVSEAINRMMPSKMLTSPADFETPMYVPSQDHLLGLYQASAAPSKKQKTRYFASWEDVEAAYKKGDIDINTPVKVSRR